MDFFVATNGFGDTLAVESTLKGCLRAIPNPAPAGLVIDKVSVPVTGDTIRRLISGEGGYATDSVQVFPTAALKAKRAGPLKLKL